ncbi:MAG: phosphoribosylformylglycinamidine cyclo-ligase [candidate division WOR-3 bacterium]|nr:MAG: phosphoribosylformylglycinamidine cyclo-ligase [candidate division WOR-3 bacterium]
MRYKDAGVDMDAAEALKKYIGPLAKSTFDSNVISDVGLFGSLYSLKGYKDPVLVASCDGVGTKLTVARMVGRWDTVGTDIVNHCVNDILCQGARPLFFLDYLAASKFPRAVVEQVVTGLARACRRAGCALVGGETAIMPGWYRTDDVDLVGFVVGVAERKKLVDKTRIQPGDVCIGLPSSGLHTNGYSLARKVLFSKARLKPGSKVKGLRCPLGAELLQPHRSYFSEVFPLLDRLHGVAHITGGGFYYNLERLLPDEVSVVVHKRAWRPKRIFRLIQQLGNVPEDEMYRTFNMGMGMVLLAPPRSVPALVRRIRNARVVGKVVRGTFGVAVI